MQLKNKGSASGHDDVAVVGAKILTSDWRGTSRVVAGVVAEHPLLIIRAVACAMIDICRTFPAPLSSYTMLFSPLPYFLYLSAGLSVGLCAVLCQYDDDIVLYKFDRISPDQKTSRSTTLSFLLYGAQE